MKKTAQPSNTDRPAQAMTGQEFMDWCARHDLTIEKGGIILGVYKATAYKYRNEELPINKTFALAAKLIDMISPEERAALFQQILAEHETKKKANT